MRCCALIVAAGAGLRFGGPKQLSALLGRPVLAWTVDAFLRCEAITSIIVVVAADQLEQVRAMLGAELDDEVVATRVTLCAGGATRSDSVRAGIARVPSSTELVAVHDGARPLIAPDLIARLVEAAAEGGATGAALPVVQPHDTVKRVAGGTVAGTLDRRELGLAQTPQVFAVPLLRRALAGAGSDATDEAQLVEALGVPVRAIDGDSRNIKITVAEDLLVASALLAGEVAMRAPRTGVGYDVHRLVVGDAVVLGGVRIPFTHALEGHSDADVLCHAAGDALLGAAALGDLGRHFPPGDPRYRGADSIQLLRQIARMVDDAGFVIGNLDCTVVCQAPRLASHVPQMRANLTQALGVVVEQVSVKATTTEGLGFTGRAEGIAAYATVVILPAPPVR